MDPYSANSSTNNFLSPIPISDWLIFCRGNLMLHKKKEMKITKHKFFEHFFNILYSELAPLTHDITCSKLLTYEGNMGDKKLSVKNPFW